MRLTQPRIEPLALDQATPEQREFLRLYEGKSGLLNIYRTTARNLDAARSFHAWGSYVLRRSKFDERLRELLILRIGWLCRSGYEWAQHARRARNTGMTDEEINRIKRGAGASGWSKLEQLILRAADELHETCFLRDGTWKGLQKYLSEEECMNLVFIVGHYTQVCMILNTFGVQLEDGAVLDDELRA